MQYDLPFTTKVREMDTLEKHWCKRETHIPKDVATARMRAPPFCTCREVDWRIVPVTNLRSLEPWVSFVRELLSRRIRSRVRSIVAFFYTDSRARGLTTNLPFPFSPLAESSKESCKKLATLLFPLVYTTVPVVL